MGHEIHMLLFAHIEKTAGTSFNGLLWSNMGMFFVESNKTKQKVFDRSDLQFARRVFFGIRGISGHNLSDPKRNLGLDNMEMITFLRDPLQRCASHYQDNVLRRGMQMSFEEWIGQKENQNFMIRSLAGKEDLGMAKRLLREDFLFVGLTEHFDDSLKMLNLVLKKPLKLRYRKSTVASSNHVKKQILEDPKSYALLKEHNALDQELYDWARQELFGPMHKRLAPQLGSQSVSQGMDLRQRINYRMCNVYNKFVYRPLVKLRAI